MTGGSMTAQETTSQISENAVNSVELLGIRLDDVTLDETVDILEGYIASDTPHLIATTNTEFIMAARKNREFRAVLNAADLSFADGIGVILGLRLFGQRVREHVRGTDVVEKLVERAAGKGYSIFMLGAQEGVAEEAAARLKERYPRLKIAGTHSGSPRPEYDDEQVALIQAAGPVDILLVAYGAPAQETWIYRNMQRTGVPVAIGVGGVFDFLAGRVPRAPRLIRRLELEWLYRLIRQPWRWRRQLVLPQFVLVVLAERVRTLIK